MKKNVLILILIIILIPFIMLLNNNNLIIDSNILGLSLILLSIIYFLLSLIGLILALDFNNIIYKTLAIKIMIILLISILPVCLMSEMSDFVKLLGRYFSLPIELQVIGVIFLSYYVSLVIDYFYNKSTTD